MKKLIFGLLYLSSSFLFSQQFQWIKKVDGIYNQLPTGNRIITTPTGESYVVGTFTGQATVGSFSLTTSSVQATYFAKYNSLGNVIWANKIISSTMVWGNAISTDKQKNVFITGIFNNDATFATTTLTSSGTAALKADIFVCKYDSNGVFIWAKNFSGTGSTNAFSIVNDSLSNSYVSGYAALTRTIGATTFSASNLYMVLFKLDQNGNPVWAVKSNGTSPQVNTYDITLDKNLNVYAFGHFGNVGSGGSQTLIFGSSTLTANLQTPDLFIAKFDNSGNPIFARKVIGNFQGDRGYGIKYDKYNHLYITGGFEGSAIFDNDTVFATPPIAGKYDCFLAKLDLNGNFKWAVKPDTLLTYQGWDVHVADPNSIYIGGEVLNTVLFKFDSIGNQKWFFKIKGGCGGCGFGISSDKNGAIYIHSTFSGTLATSVGTLTTPSSSIVNNFVAKIDTSLVTQIQPLSLNEIEINVFPNPVSSLLYISSTMEFNSSFNIEISNSIGQIIIHKPFESIIDVSQLENGFYFLKISSTYNNQFNYYCKIIKQ